jgi:DNA (cytosine-5)-methyltransferase 1
MTEQDDAAFGHPPPRYAAKKTEAAFQQIATATLIKGSGITTRDTPERTTRMLTATMNEYHDCAEQAEAAASKKERKKRPLYVADLFCGAGGTSTGAKRALDKLNREMVLTAVNHWRIAIESHRINHPDAVHICQDLASVHPLEAVPGGRLDLLVGSPSCTQHSRARGGRPVTDQSRADPWHLVTWLTQLRVTRVLVENVPEMQDWGPVNLRTGRPIEARKGEYFRAWVRTIESLGFRVKYGVLNCADYGDPTTRQRFFLIGRSDGRRLEWPTQTHSRDGRADLFGVGGKKWRPAREIIDWSTRGRSIYGRKKPLSEKTSLRILSGVVRFGWHRGYAERLVAHLLERGTAPSTIEEVVKRSAQRARETTPDTDEGTEPFIAVVAHGNETPGDNARRVRGLDLPIDAIHAGGGAFGLVDGRFTLAQGSTGAPRDIGAPLPTIVSAGAVALIAPYYGSGSGETCIGTDRPLPTMTTKARFGLVTPDGAVVDDEDATRIIPFGQRRDGVVVPLTHGDGHNRSRSTNEPLVTVTAANRGELGFITPAFGERAGQLPRTHSLETPIPTLCAQGRIDLVMDGAAQDFDILFRMLTVPELSRATGLERGSSPYTLVGSASDQIRQIGNAVPAETAEALITALMRE